MPLVPWTPKSVRSGSRVKKRDRWSAIEMMIWSGPFGGSSGRAFFANSEFVCRWWCLCLNGA